MFQRAFIRDGDTTNRDGVVQVRPQRYPVFLDDAHGAYEGDPVWCPACQSHGVSKCVQPFRVSTGPDGRQQLLDGDLCLCRCATPPRLKARHDNHQSWFSEAEIRTELTAAAGWIEYAGLADYFQLVDSLPGRSGGGGSGASFSFVDSETGSPVANRKFLVESHGAVHEGKTDKNSDAVVHTKPGEEFRIHLVFESPHGAIPATGSEGNLADKGKR